MRAADEFGKGLWVRQQMFYAALSLELHRRDPAGLDPTRVVAELQQAYTPFRHVEGTFFHASFGHLEGYSALYYTYMWSLVIAKDLFGAFRAARDLRSRHRPPLPEDDPGARRVAARRGPGPGVPRPAVLVRRLPGLARRRVTGGRAGAVTAIRAPPTPVR